MNCSNGYVPPTWTKETSHDDKINDVLYSLFSLAFDDTKWAWDSDDPDHKHCGYLEIDDVDCIDDCIEYVLDVIADTFGIYIYYPIFKGGREQRGNWVRPARKRNALEEIYGNVNFWNDPRNEYYDEEAAEAAAKQAQEPAYVKRNVRMPSNIPDDCMKANE